ncbi:hypothetical protein [Polyangium sp. 15x6]|uniref:hypothetical protein n=1 Tax=Polyangium sp. 15x6 TaxID=3042687 RepID=UPI00249C187E|nr:hypothetical protein [Polyangium sp. 15x6]MDI3284803.1 hypothetical protein [Polyangium sp. 15x6]
MHATNNETEQNSPDKIVLAFPHHIGPGTRDLTSVLLYHGRLALTVPGWRSPGPIETLRITLERAQQTAHPLLSVFRAAAHYLDLALNHARSETEALAPLGDKICTVQLIYSGTTDAYRQWEPAHDKCLTIAAVAAEQSPLYRCTAAVEFVWRVWEAALELRAGLNRIDPDAILELFSKRASQLGHPTLLFAECIINRFGIFHSGVPRIATSSGFSMDILNAIAADVPIDEGSVDADVQLESLAFYLFRHVIENFVGSLAPPRVLAIAYILDNHSDELLRMRTHCRREAAKLLARPPRPELLRLVILDILQGMQEEAQSIAKSDRDTMKTLFSSLAQDTAAWATVANLIGLTVALPNAVAVSLGIAMFSLLGAKAVKANSEQKSLLKKSPWSVVYYAKAALEDKTTGG